MFGAAYQKYEDQINQDRAWNFRIEDHMLYVAMYGTNRHQCKLGGGV